MDSINVLMLGGRRVGKTTLLTSMMDRFDWLEIVTDGNIHLSATEETGTILHYRKMELRKSFESFWKAEKNNPLVSFDLYPPMQVSTHDFDLNAPCIAGRQVSFTNIPGEYLQSSQYEHNVRELLAKSQVVIIAIDTPHMVEEISPKLGYGKYHDSYNRVKEVTRFLKSNLQDKKDPSMVIFVPVKCEKYYHQNNTDSHKLGMGMVNSMVKKGYSELIAFLTCGTVRERCTTAIMPVLTMGGIEFFEFDDHSYTGLYSFVLDPNLRKFNPMYCEQPLLLIILDIFAHIKTQNEKRWLRTWFNRAEMERLRYYEGKLRGLVKTDSALGFEILNDPLKMIS